MSSVEGSIDVLAERYKNSCRRRKLLSSRPNVSREAIQAVSRLDLLLPLIRSHSLDRTGRAGANPLGRATPSDSEGDHALRQKKLLDFAARPATDRR